MRTLHNVVYDLTISDLLYEEQKRVFGKPDGTFRPFEFEDQKDVKIMDSVIRETLRMHAPLHSLYRKVISDIPVPASLAAPSESASYIIPKGNFIVAAPGVSSMDPRIWPNAEKWEPTRWIDEKGMAATALAEYTSGGERVDYGFGQISKGTESPYQPFGAGRHR